MVVAFIITVVVGIIAKLAADEAKAWCPWLVKRLITFAASRLPESQRVRCAEEWLSHANDIPGDIGKLLHAIGIVTAAYKMTWVQRKVKAEAAKETEITVRENAEYWAAYSQADIRLQIKNRLDQISEGDRRILQAIFLQQRDTDEVCQELGISRDYLRVQLHRAKQRFLSVSNRRT